MVIWSFFSPQGVGYARLTRCRRTSTCVSCIPLRSTSLAMGVHATRYHAIACSCARTLIYWSVFQSTIVRLFACYTERNVNQCFLNGSVVRQWTCSTKRYERKREREGQRERERERLQKGCAQIVQCTLVMFMPKPQMLYVYIYILPNYIYCLYICIGYIYN